MFFEAVKAFFPDDHVIEELNPHELTTLGEPSGKLDILPTRGAF